ncbi:MAG: OadG family protein [Gammaproteobacteria bacterium]|nr:OadG family protein [Gammaproteobacteria bacterium]
MSSDLLGEGVQLMIAGMGAVFVFLTLLVLGTVSMSRLVLRFQPVAAEIASDEALPGEGEVSDEEVAAITAAIAQHRRMSV